MKVLRQGLIQQVPKIICIQHKFTLVVQASNKALNYVLKSMVWE